VNTKIKKDLRITVRVRNNILVSKRELLGVPQMQMAAIIGIPFNTYAGFELLKQEPFEMHESKLVWSAHAKTVAEYYDCQPEDIFTKDVLAVKNPVTHREVSARDLLAIGSQQIQQMYLEDHQEEAALKKRITLVLDTLSKTEKAVTIYHFGLGEKDPMTLDEIGEALHLDGLTNAKVSRTRVQQIMCKALRKLRHAARARALLDPQEAEERERQLDKEYMLQMAEWERAKAEEKRKQEEEWKKEDEEYRKAKASYNREVPWWLEGKPAVKQDEIKLRMEANVARRKAEIEAAKEKEAKELWAIMERALGVSD
jgi:hypothetical protein